MTYRYGLIGWPVAHSLSPPMQNAGFKAAGIDAEYSLVEVAPEMMDKVIPEMKTKFAGWNCTIPHKQHIIKFLDELDETAKILGSVNTVVNLNGHFKGFSTDGYGMEMSIKESFNANIKGNSLLFLGAGGAAKAVALYFAILGAKRIGILNRTVEKAIELKNEIQKINSIIEVEYDDMSAKNIDTSKYEILIQCTSVGLKAGDPTPVEMNIIHKHHKVVDMIYKRTEFLKMAEAKGCQTADGVGMLLFQGVRAWEIWTGKKAPVEAMRASLNDALRQREMGIK